MHLYNTDTVYVKSTWRKEANYYTVNSLIATTSRKRPPPVSDHFVNNRFVSQLNTVPRALS